MSAPAPSPLAVVDAEPLPRQEEVLTDAALAFVAELHRRLTPRRDELLAGPTDRKMTINALNSGAKVWLADFEDASAPTWENVVLGQLNLIDAYTRNIDFTDERTGKSYALKANEELATVVVRPRG